MKKLTIICMAFLTLMAMSCRRTTVINNRVASSTVTVYSNDWYFDNNTSWRVDIDYDAIDMDVDDHGAVLVYMNDQNTWRQIPMTFYYSMTLDDGTVGYYSSSLEVSSYLGGLSIFWTENDFYDGYRPDNHDFKIVVIPADVYGSRSDVNYEDYNAVKTAFQLAD